MDKDLKGCMLLFLHRLVYYSIYETIIETMHEIEDYVKDKKYIK